MFINNCLQMVAFICFHLDCYLSTYIKRIISKNKRKSYYEIGFLDLTFYTKINWLFRPEIYNNAYFIPVILLLIQFIKGIRKFYIQNVSN